MEKAITREEELLDRARFYERTFGMKSADFFTRWENNELPHTDEFFDWAGLCVYLGVRELESA